MAGRKLGGNRTSRADDARVTAGATGPAPEQQQSSASPTGASRVMAFFHTQLGSTIVGVLLGFFFGILYSGYQARTADQAKQEERIHAERVALTEEISPWLLELYDAASSAASPLLRESTPAQLQSMMNELQPFTQVPRTTLLSARLAYAFGLDTQLKYDALIRMDAELDSELSSLHAYRSGPVYSYPNSKKVDPAPEIDRITRTMTDKVNNVVVAAYELGERLRAETYGLRPPEAVSAEMPTLVTCHDAQLAGIVRLNGTITDGWFQWGPTKELGTATSKGGFDVGTSNEGSISDKITGLAPNTTYYWRAVASNPRGVGYGDVRTFTTPPCQ